MPFGCLTLGEKKDYNNPSEVTDKYDLGQIVKSEEFCEIFRAKDRNTLKMFTCKKFHKKDGRKVRKAAKNEIMILKMVKHHNILQLVDTFETKKEYFLFLELATGREVFDWILDQGYYSERDTSNVMRQVLEAVAYLHSLKIVHRNLKLENLVYFNRLKHSKIVISDFQLAKVENGLIKDPCGTPEYLAPEVVGRQRYGRPVDCWAIGVIMYILLSGNPPFYDDAEEDDSDNRDKNLFLKILSGDYEFDSPYWDDISDSAKTLVASLMEVDQDQRLTAQEAIAHEWISGNAASDKNIKDGVCAQIEKNFAKAKWKKAVRVTTLMKRLRASEQGESGASGLAAGAAADPNAPGGAPALPVGNSDTVDASIKAALREKAPDTQTATVSTLGQPSAAGQDEQPQTRFKKKKSMKPNDTHSPTYSVGAPEMCASLRSTDDSGDHRGEMFGGRDRPMPDFRGREGMNMGHMGPRPLDQPSMDMRRMDAPPMRSRDMDPRDMQGREPNRDFFRPEEEPDFNHRRHLEISIREKLMNSAAGLPGPGRNSAEMGGRGMSPRDPNSKFMDMRDRESFHHNMPQFNNPNIDGRRGFPVDRMERNDGFRDMRDRPPMGTGDGDRYEMDLPTRERRMMDTDRRGGPPFNPRGGFDSDTDFRNRPGPSAEFRGRDRSPLRFGNNDVPPVDRVRSDIAGPQRCGFMGAEGALRERDYPDSSDSPLMDYRCGEEMTLAEEWKNRQKDKAPFLNMGKGVAAVSKPSFPVGFGRDVNVRDSPSFQKRDRPSVEFPRKDVMFPHGEQFPVIDLPPIGSKGPQDNPPPEISPFTGPLVRDGVPMQGMKINNVVPGYSYDTAYVEFLNLEDAVHFMESNKGSLKVGTRTATMKFLQPDEQRGVHVSQESDHKVPQLQEPQLPRPDKTSQDLETNLNGTKLKGPMEPLPNILFQRNSDLTPEAWQQQVDQQLQQQETEQQSESWANRALPKNSSQRPESVFKDSKTMIIKNVKPTTTVEAILKALDPFAYLDERNVRLVKAKSPGAKCFCFVDMDSHEQVTRLVELLTKPRPLYVDGVRVYAEVAKPLKNQNIRRDFDKPNTSILGYAPEAGMMAQLQFTQPPPFLQPLQPPAAAHPAGMQGDLLNGTSLSTDPSISQGVGYCETQSVDPSLHAVGLLVPPESAGMSSIADGSQAYICGSEVPDVSNYLYDATSGFFYDPETTLYYDPNSRKPSETPLTEEAPAAAHLSAPESVLASAATTPEKKEDDDAAKKDKEKDNKDEKPKSLAAVKIMKDMERWAKIQNRQKDSVRAPSPLLRTGLDDDRRQSKSADAGFAVFERKISGGDDLFKKPLAPPKKDEKSKRPMGSLGLLASDYGAGSDEEVEEDKDDFAKGSQGIQSDDKDDKLTDWKKMACLLCRRQFPNKDALLRHQQLSDLHKQNMEIHLKIKRSKKELEALENQEKELNARDVPRSPEQKRRKHHQQPQHHNTWAGSSRWASFNKPCY
ncbi:putative RNA-binding protein 6-like isoform 3 [Scophthalmus maximus]|uniref:CaM kinase-like vesicle-associated protein n=1 Tax=Scophthalmus maximus TaxID=52904 RepID=A0A2U9BFD5_SCOMX|nr:putative RNA-binding protein 6-like isoform 3 [Scophthalmus maximus]